MKKSTILASLAVAGLLAACDKEINPPADTPRERQITFNFTVAGSFVPTTRVATLYSTDAIQAIEAAKVYVFKSDDDGATYKYLKLYDFDEEWTKGNNSVTRSLARADMLANGKYRFLAVGADNNTDFTMPTFTVGMDYATLEAQLAAAAPQEFFAGYADKEFKTNMESVTVIMHRRVSGVLLYVAKVPTTMNARTVGYLRLSISATTKRLLYTDGNPAFTTPPAADQPGYDVFNVDVKSQGDADSDGFYDGVAIGGGVGQLPGSTIVGAYLMPAFYGSMTQPTMTLKVIADDGSTVLHQWTVRDSANKDVYDIKPNYIYSIGRKLKSANTNNGTPDDPSDDDQPIDMSKEQVLDARINSGWEQTVQMVLDDGN